MLESRGKTSAPASSSPGSRKEAEAGPRPLLLQVVLLRQTLHWCRDCWCRVQVAHGSQSGVSSVDEYGPPLLYSFEIVILFEVLGS